MHSQGIYLVQSCPIVPLYHPSLFVTYELSISCFAETPEFESLLSVVHRIPDLSSHWPFADFLDPSSLSPHWPFIDFLDPSSLSPRQLFADLLNPSSRRLFVNFPVLSPCCPLTPSTVH